MYLRNYFKYDSYLRSGKISVPINKGEKREDGTFCADPSAPHSIQTSNYYSSTCVIFIHWF